jgi:biopolymer transport protein TolQ
LISTFSPSVLGSSVLPFANVAVAQGTVLNLFAQSGTMVQAVLMLLLIFSVSSWGIIFYKIYQLRQARSASQSFATLFRSTKDFAMLAGVNLTAQNSPLARIFSTAYQEFSQWRQGASQTSTLENRSSAHFENLELTLRRFLPPRRAPPLSLVSLGPSGEL